MIGQRWWGVANQVSLSFTVGLEAVVAVGKCVIQVEVMSHLVNTSLPLLLTSFESARSSCHVIQLNNTITTSITSGITAKDIDFMSVMKASRAISREIVFSELLKKMMNVIIENAGAQKGMLLLESEGNYRIEVIGEAGNTDPQIYTHVI